MLNYRFHPPYPLRNTGSLEGTVNTPSAHKEAGLDRSWFWVLFGTSVNIFTRGPRVFLSLPFSLCTLRQRFVDVNASRESLGQVWQEELLVVSSWGFSLSLNLFRPKAFSVCVCVSSMLSLPSQSLHLWKNVAVTSITTPASKRWSGGWIGVQVWAGMKRYLTRPLFSHLIHSSSLLTIL